MPIVQGSSVRQALLQVRDNILMAYEGTAYIHAYSGVL